MLLIYLLNTLILVDAIIDENMGGGGVKRPDSDHRCRLLGRDDDNGDVGEFWAITKRGSGIRNESTH